jgi:hypothetical protein
VSSFTVFSRQNLCRFLIVPPGTSWLMHMYTHMSGKNLWQRSKTFFLSATDWSLIVFPYAGTRLGERKLIVACRRPRSAILQVDTPESTVSWVTIPPGYFFKGAL